jgi:hypothetical protein
VAALALVGAIIYLVVSKGPASDDPTDVKVGSEQREYGDDPMPTSTATATAEPKPAPKKGVVVPKPKSGEDIYEGGDSDIYDGL